VLRSHIDHRFEASNCVHNLQRGTIRRRWCSRTAYENVEEMVIVIVQTVQMWENVQTMGTQAAAVDFPEMIASKL
jgi:hypothetical protein